MRTSTRGISATTKFERPERPTRITNSHGLKTIIELNVAEVKIHLIGEHCEHCKKTHEHLLNIEKLAITNH